MGGKEKIGKYLTILVCVLTLQLMGSQKDSLLLSALKEKTGLMSVSIMHKRLPVHTVDLLEARWRRGERIAKEEMWHYVKRKT